MLLTSIIATHTAPDIAAANHVPKTIYLATLQVIVSKLLAHRGLIRRSQVPRGVEIHEKPEIRDSELLFQNGSKPDWEDYFLPTYYTEYDDENIARYTENSELTLSEIMADDRIEYVRVKGINIRSLKIRLRCFLDGNVLKYATESIGRVVVECDHVAPSFPEVTPYDQMNVYMTIPKIQKDVSLKHSLPITEL